VDVIEYMDITTEMKSLLEKLDAIDLTEGERTAFGQLLGLEADADPETAGFTYQKITWTVQGFNLGVVLERARQPVPRSVVDHKGDD
jgi:hypothetical protein